MTQGRGLRDRIARMARRLPHAEKYAPWRLAAAQGGLLLVVAALLLWPAPFTLTLLPAGALTSDLMRSHWPTALLLQRTMDQSHRLPLWNPYFGGGQPLGADPLAAVFYPPTQLATILPLRTYYLVLLMGHLLLAGVGMLLLARWALGLGRLPALVAAISFMATPRLLSHLGAGHVTLVQTVAWLPWLALGCWATVRAPRRWGPLLGLGIALTLLAGHPQMAYYALLMTAGVSVWLLVRRWQVAGRRAALVSAVGLGAAALVGALVASIHLVPLMEFTARSTRELSVGSTDTYPLPSFLQALVGFEHPGPFPWEGMLFPGLAVLLLAALALARRWRQAWPLLLGIALVAALAMGNASPLYLAAARVLPDFDRFRGLARIWFLALVGFALLAGLGTAALLTFVRSRGSARVELRCGLAVVLLVAASLLVTDWGTDHPNDVAVSTAPSALAVTAARLAGSGRIYGLQRNIPQVDAVELGARLADGWDPLLLENYAAYMQRASGYSYGGYQLTIPAVNLDDPRQRPPVQAHLDARLLGLMDVRIVLSRTPLGAAGLEPAGQVGGTWIYRNTLDAGPGYLVRPGPGGRLPTLDQLHPVDAGVRAETPAPERSSFSFTAPTAGYFVVATPSFPGWVATLDGHAVPVQTIAGVLPAVRVGPGTHHLSYTYAPRSVPLGAALSLVGLLAALAWLVVAFDWERVARLWAQVARRQVARAVA